MGEKVTPNTPAVLLAKKLINIAPKGLTKVFYSDNGSTAVEVALKMALQYWWNKREAHSSRLKIIAFTNSYHGDTFGSMSVSDRSVFTKAFHDLLFDVVFIDTPTADNLAQSKALIAFSVRVPATSRWLAIISTPAQ